MTNDSRQSSILDDPAISGNYLFPQPRRIRDPFLVRIGDVQLACHHNILDPDAYTIVHFHGNGEAVADYIPDMSDRFAGMGLNSLFVEYREYGESTGEAQLVAMLGDGQAAITAAGLNPKKVVAFGRSIGSLYAIELAHRYPEIGGLIIESGIADAAERFLTYADLATAGFDREEVLAEARRHFHHRAKLSNYDGPLLILHTEHDGLVDISHAERNFTWAETSFKQLVRFPMGDHNSIIPWNRDEYFASIGGFVNQIAERDPN